VSASFIWWWWWGVTHYMAENNKNYINFEKQTLFWAFQAGDEVGMGDALGYSDLKQLKNNNNKKDIYYEKTNTFGRSTPAIRWEWPLVTLTLKKIFHCQNIEHKYEKMMTSVKSHLL
jgi:hypothetical protein